MDALAGMALPIVVYGSLTQAISGMVIEQHLK